MTEVLDGLTHHTTIVITKYESDKALRAGEMYAPPVVHEGNAFTPRGTRMLWKLFSGQGAGNEFYSSTNSYLFVSNSSAAVVIGITGQPYDLQGANKSGAIVDAGFPTQTSYGLQTLSYNQIAYQATFGAGIAQYTWLDMGLVNGSSVSAPGLLTDAPVSGTLFNRAVAPDVVNGWGTKVAGVVWVATMLISVS